MSTPPQGNAYYILSQQYVAAVLNGASGSQRAAPTSRPPLTVRRLTSQPTLRLRRRDGSVQGSAHRLGKHAGPATTNGLVGPGHCGTNRPDLIAGCEPSSQNGAQSGPRSLSAPDPSTFESTSSKRMESLGLSGASSVDVDLDHPQTTN